MFSESGITLKLHIEENVLFSCEIQKAKKKKNLFALSAYYADTGKSLCLRMLLNNRKQVFEY